MKLIWMCAIASLASLAIASPHQPDVVADFDVSLLQIDLEVDSAALRRSSNSDGARSCLEYAITKRIESRMRILLNTTVAEFQSTGKTDSFLLVANGVDASRQSPTGSQPVYVEILTIIRALMTGAPTAIVTSNDLDGYVTFTRFAKGIDKFSCDWCSVVNGVVELELAILRNMSSNDVVPPECELGSPIYEEDADRSPTDGQLACFDLDSDFVHPEIVRQILSKRNDVEYIEQRWCPFKHLRKLNFNRSYYSFSAELEADLAQAQAVLIEKDRITGDDVTCDKCNKVINEELVAFSQHDQETSLFEDDEIGATYMDLVRCAFGISCTAVNNAIALSSVKVLASKSDNADADSWHDYAVCLETSLAQDE